MPDAMEAAEQREHRPLSVRAMGVIGVGTIATGCLLTLEAVTGAIPFVELPKSLDGFGAFVTGVVLVAEGYVVNRFFGPNASS